MVSILMAGKDGEEITRLREVAEASTEVCSLYAVGSAVDCVKYLEEEKVDLFILDVDLNDMSGIDLADLIRKTPGYEFTWIVFLSKDSAAETEAYKKIRCYDFLIKPIDVSQLSNTIRLLSNYVTTPRTIADSSSVTFRQRDQVHRIMTNDILYIEVIGNNSTVYTYSRVYCLRKTSLKKLQLMLPDYFVQCHKSFIVNRNYIESIQKGTYGWEINLKNYHRSVPSGDKYKGNVLNFA